MGRRDNVPGCDLHRTLCVMAATLPMPKLTLLQRLARIAPYFRASRGGFVVAFAAAATAAATEPMIPALLKYLLDHGFGAARSFPLWMVPVAIVGLFMVRGLAAFLANYALAWAANRGVMTLREVMFTRLMNATPTLFTQHNASSLTNSIVYEAQAGAVWLVQAPSIRTSIGTNAEAAAWRSVRTAPLARRACLTAWKH